MMSPVMSEQKIRTPLMVMRTCSFSCRTQMQFFIQTVGQEKQAESREISDNLR